MLNLQQKKNNMHIKLYKLTNRCIHTYIQYIHTYNIYEMIHIPFAVIRVAVLLQVLHHVSLTQRNETSILHVKAF